MLTEIGFAHFSARSFYEFRKCGFTWTFSAYVSFKDVRAMSWERLLSCCLQRRSHQIVNVKIVRSEMFLRWIPWTLHEHNSFGNREHAIRPKFLRFRKFCIRKTEIPTKMNKNLWTRRTRFFVKNGADYLLNSVCPFLWKCNDEGKHFLSNLWKVYDVFGRNSHNCRS